MSQWLFLLALSGAAIWACDEVFFEFLRGLRSRRIDKSRTELELMLAESITNSDKNIAILIPTWGDSKELGATVTALVDSCDESQAIFIGCWQEDDDAYSEAVRLSCQYPQVHHCDLSNRHCGVRAACVNEIVEFVRMYEDDTGDEFDGYLVHSPGDRLHPDAVALVAASLTRHDVVLLPTTTNLTTNLDEKVGFAARLNADCLAEFYHREMAVRATLGTVSSPEPVFAFSRRVFATLKADVNVTTHDVSLMSPSSLAPDYELCQRLSKQGGLSTSAPLLLAGDDATRSGFKNLVAANCSGPASLKEIIVIRSRRALGTAVDGWRRHGWYGGWSNAYGQWRDRRQLILGLPVLALITGALIMLAAAAVAGAPLRFELSDNLKHGVIGMSMLVLLAVMLKVVHRHVAVARLRSTAALAGVIPRMIAELGIDISVTAMTIVCWLRGSSRVSLNQGLSSGGQFQKVNPAAASTRVFKNGPFQHQPIGELLIDWHVLNRVDRDRALRKQAESGQRIGRILVNQGLVTESTIVEAVAHQISVDMVEVNADVVPASMGALLSLGSMLKHRVYPFRYSDDKNNVMLACYRLPQPDAVLALRAEIGSPIRLCLARRTDVRQLLRKYSQLSRSVDQRFIAASSESVGELSERVRLQAAQRRRSNVVVESRPLLGEHLVRSGCLDRKTLRDCLLRAVRSDQSLSDYLIENGLVPAGTIEAMAARMARGNGIRLAAVNGHRLKDVGGLAVGSVDQG